MSVNSELSEAEVTYRGYLRLGELLNLLKPVSSAHDEPLFITTHQTFELWFRLILYELEAARVRIWEGNTSEATRLLLRVATVESLLTSQFDILDTMTSQGFLEFRDRLNSASGFHSVQFREIELLSGLGDAGWVKLTKTCPEDALRLERRRHEPTMWNAFQELVTRSGCQTLTDVFDQRHRYKELFELSEAMISHDEAFALWRSRHVRLVERMIGISRGTGGTTGASYLNKTLPKRFFPELLAARSRAKDQDGGRGRDDNRPEEP